MIPLIVDKKAMTVPTSLKEFLVFKKTYNCDMWIEVAENNWECGEVGQWIINPDQQTAVYQESNLFGILPLGE